MKTTYRAQSVLRWSTAIVRLLDRLINRTADTVRNRRIKFARRNS